MAQSIKLGNDVYLDASGVDGIKAVLTNGDLNDYYGIHKSGVYYLNGSASAFSNCPQGYSTLFVYSGTSGGAQQMILQRSGIWYRDRSGSPVTWGDWRKITGGDTIDISSQFVWNTTDITFTSKNIVAFYDPVSKLVTGNIEYEASSAIPTAIGWHAQIPSGYRPSSNTQQGCMYYHSSSGWRAGWLYFRSNGNVNQNITNYWQNAVCSFVYKVG